MKARHPAGRLRRTGKCQATKTMMAVARPSPVPSQSAAFRPAAPPLPGSWGVSSSSVLHDERNHHQGVVFKYTLPFPFPRLRHGGWKRRGCAHRPRGSEGKARRKVAASAETWAPSGLPGPAAPSSPHPRPPQGGSDPRLSAGASLLPASRPRRVSLHTGPRFTVGTRARVCDANLRTPERLSSTSLSVLKPNFKPDAEAQLRVPVSAGLQPGACDAPHRALSAPKWSPSTACEITCVSLHSHVCVRVCVCGPTPRSPWHPGGTHGASASRPGRGDERLPPRPSPGVTDAARPPQTHARGSGRRRGRASLVRPTPGAGEPAAQKCRRTQTDREAPTKAYSTPFPGCNEAPQHPHIVASAALG